MCTGRVDLGFILRAFHGGADGVIIGGCWPGECHYVTEGNYDALGNVHLCRKLLERVGVRPERLRLEWFAASEGSRFAEVMSDFTRQVGDMGAIDRAEGIDGATLRLKLEALHRLVPYLKLVEREKLRAPERSQEAYDAWYQGEEVNRLFDDLVADRLAISEILLLLRDGPLSTVEISRRLALSPSEVFRHMSTSSSLGLVRYDPARGSYVLVRPAEPAAS